MFCPKCGQQIADDAKFCGFCGATIENANPAQGTQAPPAGGPVPPVYPGPGYPYPPYPVRKKVEISATNILYMAACFLHLMLLIFWWIPSLGPKGDKYSLFKTFTNMKATFPAVLIIIFLIVGFCILLYYALAPFIGKELLKKYDKGLKLASIDMHMLMLFGTMTVMGSFKGLLGGFGGDVPVGFPIVFIYICLCLVLVVEAYAYISSEILNKK